MRSEHGKAPTRRLLVVGVAVLLSSAAVWSACSGDTEVADRPDAGSDSGSGGTGGTSVGGGGNGGAGATGGLGGTGGATTDAGDWGAEPAWQAIPGTAVGCSFERMTNAAEVRMFKWEKCPWADGCEQAVFNPTLFSKSPGVMISPGWSVHDDGAVTRIALAFLSPLYAGVFADSEGMGLALIRLVDGSGDCYTPAAAVWGERFAVLVDAFTDPKSHGGVLGGVGASTGSPSLFTLPNAVGGPQRFALGATRWVWEWGMPNRLTGISALDGSGFTEIAKAFGGGDYAGIAEPVSTGSTFLANYYQIFDGGDVQARIGWSDGTSPLQPYLIPEQQSDGYGAVAYAHTHVGFQKGVTKLQDFKYTSVELWAAKYDPNATKVQPELVASLPHDAIGGLVGGFGHLAMPIFESGATQSVLTIWDLAKSTTRKHPSLPKDHVLKFPLLGLTRSHLWAGAAKPNWGPASYLMRFDVE